MKKLTFKKQLAEPMLLRLDLGAGKGRNTPEGFMKIDKIKYPGLDKVVDLCAHQGWPGQVGKFAPWPWKTGSVDEVHSNYLLPFLTPRERVHCMNELYRVLKPGAKAQMITPYWAACKGYGDVTTYYPPIAEAWYARLNKAWRDAQNYDDPDGYTCNFDHTVGYGLHPTITARNMEYQQHAVSFFKEAAQDLVATLIKV